MIFSFSESLGVFSIKSIKSVGSFFSKFTNLANFMVGLSVATILGATCIYKNPVSAAKVLYSEFTGSKIVKHVHVQEAEYLFARRENLQFLDGNALRSFSYEVGVVPFGTNDLADEDIGWDRLLEFISQNKKYGREPIRVNYTGFEAPGKTNSLERKVD